MKRGLLVLCMGLLMAWAIGTLEPYVVGHLMPNVSAAQTQPPVVDWSKAHETTPVQFEQRHLIRRDASSPPPPVSDSRYHSLYIAPTNRTTWQWHWRWRCWRHNLCC